MTPEEASAKFPVGTPVRYFPTMGFPDEFEDAVIRSEVWALGHGELVVKITGRAGGVCITHLKPRPPMTEDAARAKTEAEITIESDDLYAQAVQFTARREFASISGLKRELRVGYNRCARLLEAMEEQGIISRPDRLGIRVVVKGAKP